LSGADDYVTKPFSPRELVARVYAVLRRASASDGRSPMTADFGRLRLDPLERRAYIDGRNVSLTPKEFGLLEALCSTPNVPWTRSRLLERVFGFDYEGTERSVDTHVLNLRRKLGDTGYPRVHTVFGVGYKIVAK
jgi:DNA-binding response OmpR family regulator